MRDKPVPALDRRGIPPLPRVSAPVGICKMSVVTGQGQLSTGYFRGAIHTVAGARALGPLLSRNSLAIGIVDTMKFRHCERVYIRELWIFNGGFPATKRSASWVRPGRRASYSSIFWSLTKLGWGLSVSVPEKTVYPV